MIKRRKKQEDTFIDQLLYPKLEQLGIERRFIKRNVSTLKSGMQRGDLWIADTDYSSPDFEKRILCLIECKDTSVTIGDKDWQDAIKQGKQKSKKQGLKSFFVTNTLTLTRCYNEFSLKEITIDSIVINEIQPFPILRAMLTIQMYWFLPLAEELLIQKNLEPAFGIYDKFIGLVA